MAQTPPVKEGFRAGGNKYNPQKRLPFYTPNWLKQQKGANQGRVEGSRLQPVRMPEDLGHEDLGLGKKQTSRVRGSRACPRAEPIETSSTVVLSYFNYHKLSTINSKRLQLPHHHRL